MNNIEVFAIEGIGEVTAGTDLVSVIEQAYINYQPQDGDVLVVTSKIVSKAEARTLPAGDRDEAITAESFGEVATNGPTRIVRTRHGFVMAAAGVDASNTSARRWATRHPHRLVRSWNGRKALRGVYGSRTRCFTPACPMSLQSQSCRHQRRCVRGVPTWAHGIRVGR